MLACAFSTAPALGWAEQTPQDRADASVLEEELAEEAPTGAERRIRIEPPPAGQTRSDVAEPIVAGAIRIEGAEAVPLAAFGAVVERYAGRTLAPSALRGLAADVAAVARSAGYGLATAWIPAQRVENGVLRVRVDEGRIDAVDVRGSGRAAAAARLAAIADGRPMRTAVLERRLLLADDLPGIRLGKARLVRRGDRNVLVVAAVRDRVEGRGSLDNWGSSTAGPVRVRLSLDVNALLAEDDRLSLDGVVTPLEPREFALLRAAYTAALGENGTEVTVGGYVAVSEAGGALTERDLEGDSREVSAEIRHPLVRSRKASAWLSMAGTVRNSSQTREDEQVRDDRIVSVAATLYGFHQIGDGRLRGRIALVQGLGVLGATEMGDPLASRADADGTFSKVEVWGDYEHRLTVDMSLLLQWEGQLAGGPLLSSEEMGLGGRAFGRAWDFREFSGDRGFAGSIELRYRWKTPLDYLKAVQIYTYLDGGTVSNLGAGTSGGSIASVGGGVRLWLPATLRATIGVGIPLTHGSDTSGGDDPRLSFSLDKRF